jgi:hypothetical protein
MMTGERHQWDFLSDKDAGSWNVGEKAPVVVLPWALGDL